MSSDSLHNAPASLSSISAEWQNLLTHFEWGVGFSFVVILVPNAQDAEIRRQVGLVSGFDRFGFELAGLRLGLAGSVAQAGSARLAESPVGIGRPVSAGDTLPLATSTGLRRAGTRTRRFGCLSA